VLNGVILRPLAYPDSGRLLMLFNVYPGFGVNEGSNAVPECLERKAMTGVFDSVALIRTEGYDTGIEGAPQRVEASISLRTTSASSALSRSFGRAFTAEEASIGKDHVVVLSYGLWKDLFAGDRNVLGRDLRLGSRPYRIIGVMPEGFADVDADAHLWVPFAFTPQQVGDDARHSNSWGMIARLKPGVTAGEARQRIDALNRSNMERFPKFRQLLDHGRFATRVVLFAMSWSRTSAPHSTCYRPLSRWCC
jgi:hypothetical protein